MTLFKTGSFFLHSGGRSDWLIEAKELTELDWAGLAQIAVSELNLPPFSWIWGVPDGGNGLTSAMKEFQGNEGPTLICDDVYTTGASMEAARWRCIGEPIGLVAFSRARKVPDWITVIWQLGQGRKDEQTKENLPLLRKPQG